MLQDEIFPSLLLQSLLLFGNERWWQWYQSSSKNSRVPVSRSKMPWKKTRGGGEWEEKAQVSSSSWKTCSRRALFSANILWKTSIQFQVNLKWKVKNWGYWACEFTFCKTSALLREVLGKKGTNFSPTGACEALFSAKRACKDRKHARICNFAEPH